MDSRQHKNQLQFRQTPKQHSCLINLFIRTHIRNWISVKEKMQGSCLPMLKHYLQKSLTAPVKHLKKEIVMKWMAKSLQEEKTVSYRMEKIISISAHLTGEHFGMLRLK